jgi:hypothetical protein
VSPEAKKFVKNRQSSDPGPQKALVAFAQARAKKAEKASDAKEAEMAAAAKKGRRFYVNSQGEKIYIK